MMECDLTIVVFKNDVQGECKSMKVEVNLACKCKPTAIHCLEKRTDS